MENRQENETEGSKLPVENHEKGGSTQGAESVSGRPRRFGRGIYDKTDTPIRLLDGFIVGVIIVIVVMVVVFALFGGYTVAFDTSGGTEIASQKLRYGNYIEEPEDPVRQGYEFDGWYYEGHEEETWDFSVDKVGGDLTLIARWEPAEKITTHNYCAKSLHKEYFYSQIAVNTCSPGIITILSAVIFSPLYSHPANCLPSFSGMGSSP